ncbi:MAG: ABC transporter ATP-binding protein, partial [Erysipelotrichaceae bacterium]|nr:ABC transporter ATP-binding protein [Erysipelotrichaceae bacterium]
IGEKIGFVMQNPNQMLVKNIIKEEVAFALALRNLPQEEIDRRVQRALTVCGLWPMRNWPVSAVSYGQRKRITVAAMLALDTEVLILDEPTAGQDYRHYTEIMDFLDDLNRQTGITIIFITHDMHLAIEYTDRAIVFADGEKIADDLVVEVLSDNEIIQKANLKQTSLYTLAMRLGLPAQTLVDHFIGHEREVKIHE